MGFGLDSLDPKLGPGDSRVQGFPAGLLNAPSAAHGKSFGFRV